MVQTLGADGWIPAGDYQNASASLTQSSWEAGPHRAPLFPGPLRGLSLSMGLAIRYQTPCRSPIRVMLIRGFRVYILTPCLYLHYPCSMTMSLLSEQPVPQFEQGSLWQTPGTPAVSVGTPAFATPHHKLVTEPAQLDTLLPRLLPAPLIAVDTEPTGLD